MTNLSHDFGEKSLFRKVSFRLLKGEHVGLVGLNGVGKTTLLRLLTKELLPDQGSIEWLKGVKFGYLQQEIIFSPQDSIQDYLRGAFAELLALEEEYLKVAGLMKEAGREECERLGKRLGYLQERLEKDDIYTIDSKIGELAAGLGIVELGMETKVRELSGGKRTKLLLTKLLLERPHVLLLDEPTNYLDEEHVVWLSSYLKEYKQAFIVISHDINFLNDVTRIIFHIENQGLMRYAGNYQKFLAAHELGKAQLQNAYKFQQREIKKLETYIAKNRAKASKAKSAKSRAKKLEKIERIQLPAKPVQVAFNFKVQPKMTGVVVECQKLNVGYKKPLFAALTLRITAGAKIALVGYNGIGKSTLLRTLLGMLPPLAGKLVWNNKVVPAYFAQENENKNLGSALEEMQAAFPKLLPEQVRTLLGQCGLRANLIGRPLDTLSGGEQAKFRLCNLMCQQNNWLVLDEPANHLDHAAKLALKQALSTYAGTVLLVSHERDFFKDWVTEIWDVEQWL
ncbi:MAG: hypothetical protein RLZ12_111 [Bacillota bacterium]